MTKTIILHGMHTSVNFGDLLLSAITIGWIKESGRYRVVGARIGQEVSQILGIEQASARDWIHADAVILSGGGYFQRDDRGRSAAKAYAKYLWPLMLGAMLRRPVAVLGVGVSTPPHPLLFRWLKAVVKTCSFASVRDSVSYNTLSCLGNVTLTADLALSLNSTLPHEGEPLVKAHDWLFSRVVALHLSAPSSAGPAYAELYDRLEAALSENPDIGVLLIEDHPSDHSLQRQAQIELQQRIGEERTRIVHYTSGPALCALLASVDAVFTNKLHVGLTAAALGTPPFSVAKHSKNIASFREMGLQEHCCSLSREAGDQMSIVIGKWLSVQERLVLPAAIRDRAQENKELLQRFLASL